MKVSITSLLMSFLLLSGTACSSETEAPEVSDESSIETTELIEEEQGPVYAHHASEELPDIFKEWHGDLSGMVERRVIRALVPWSDTYYYLDGVRQKGIAYEAMTIFEKWLNEEIATGTIEMHVVILPVRRDLLLSFIAEGRGDLALGGITVTDERREQVDFSAPASKEVQEWLVESASATPLHGLDDLSGREIHVRRSSSYWESLQTINADFEARGLARIDVRPADEYLSTEDLLQMVNAAVIPYTVADHEIAEYWATALPDIRVRDDIVVRSGARYAWALRQGNQELKTLLDRFLSDHRQGTLMGNVVVNKYLKDTSRLQSINGEKEQERLNEVIDHFEEYALEYKFDAIMMVAQGFQESRLDQSKQSHRGAMGIMQLLPSTAADPAVDIEDISTAENNILAGVRYMAWIRNTYFDDPSLDDFNQTAMAFASYNAGPNRIRGLRKRAQERGLDPNVWFDNVELMAAEDIGRETVEYVANIYKYYLAFKLAEQRQAEATTL